MTTKVKIAISVVVVVVVVVIIYFILRDKPTGNKYASAETLAKIKKGGYGTYADNIPTADYNTFWNTLVNDLGYTEPEAFIGNIGGTGESLTRGWLKGMNIAMNSANAIEFASEIKKYNSAPGSLPHWKVTTGQYLK